MAGDKVTPDNKTPGDTNPQSLSKLLRSLADDLAGIEPNIDDPAILKKIENLISELNKVNEQTRDLGPDETSDVLPPEDSIIKQIKTRLRELGQQTNPELRADPATDPLQQEIAADSTLPEDLILVVGIASNSPRGPKYRRLYLTLQFNEYIEFAEDDLVLRHDLGSDLIDGTVIWLRPEASVGHVRSETFNLQRTFLQGGISGSASALPQFEGRPGLFMGGGSLAAWCGGGSLGAWCGGGSLAAWCGGGSLAAWCGGGSGTPWCGGGSLAAWCGGGWPRP